MFPKGTATFTQGSKTVTSISMSAGDISAVARGSRLDLGTLSPPANIIEAVDRDINANTITLRDNFNGTTGTYSFVITYTSDGFRDAATAMRDARESLVLLTDTADVNPNPDTFAQRDVNGNVKTGEPIADDDATPYSISRALVRSYATTAELENSRPTQTGQRAENRERANAQYELAASGYTAKPGDIVAANGRVWKLVGGSYNQSLTVNVPSHYAALQDAIDYYHNKVLFTDGSELVINIESGHQPSTGISVSNGDYSYIRITSDDAEVVVASGFGQSAAFIEGDNAEMPRLDCLINGNSGQLGIGYMCHNGSVGYITEGNGVKNCWQDGLAVRYGSTCYAQSTVWTGNAINGTTSSGIVSWSSVVHAEGADASDSGYYGAQAAHGGSLSFQNGKANNTARYGIRASDGAVIDADGATANDNAVNGVRAFNGCVVNFRSGTATGNGSENIASSGSFVEAADAVITGSLGVGVLAIGSTVRLSQANVSGAAGVGLQAFGSTVFAQSLNADNCVTGIVADDASTIHAGSADCSNCASNGMSALNGSTINAELATCNDNGQYGMNAWYGSTINAVNAACQRGGVRGVYAFSGSTINAKGVNAQKTDGSDTGGSNADITCLEGSTINARSAIGGVNKTVNNLNADGVIYQ